jgi:hypothetical protein
VRRSAFCQVRHDGLRCSRRVRLPSPSSAAGHRSPAPLPFVSKNTQETGASRNRGAGTGPIACTPFVHAGSISSAWRRWVHGEACIESRRIDLPCGMAIAGSRERGITASPSVARITERGARTSPSMGRTAYRKMRRRELPSGILFSGRLVSWAWPRCAELPSPSLPCSVGRCLPPLR